MSNPVPEFTTTPLNSIRYSQSNISACFSARGGRKETAVLNKKLLTDLPPMVVVPLESNSVTTADNRRRRHYEHHNQTSCDVLKVPHGHSIQKYLVDKIYQLPLLKDKKAASKISGFYCMHIGYWSKENKDLVLLTWRIRTLGQFVEARCLAQEDDFPIYGRIAPVPTVGSHSRKELNIRLNDREPPDFSQASSEIFRSSRIYVATNTDATPKASLFTHEVRSVDSIRDWLAALRSPEIRGCYTIITGVILDQRRQPSTSPHESEEDSDIDLGQQEFPPLGQTEVKSASSQVSKSKNRRSRPEDADIDNLIAESIAESILDDHADEDLDEVYRWTVGVEGHNAGHYTVTSNEDLEQIPVGGSFDATRRNMLLWNEDWLRFFSADDDSGSSEADDDTSQKIADLSVSSKTQQSTIARYSETSEEDDDISQKFSDLSVSSKTQQSTIARYFVNFYVQQSGVTLGAIALAWMSKVGGPVKCAIMKNLPGSTIVTFVMEGQEPKVLPSFDVKNNGETVHVHIGCVGFDTSAIDQARVCGDDDEIPTTFQWQDFDNPSATVDAPFTLRIPAERISTISTIETSMPFLRDKKRHSLSKSSQA
ncbi:uncharacterized protein SPPG_04807 [Spizellomyces punctatus DAOM BR117]|uniref:Uncharacterized protein n=1 Tax=Spizellomyces punctatus (strain DAOM BR117) TaxID=645134 RepID=A0A0L0HG68_SPIPD|nr:uncharacterized protein SPPG_04807 [Spizellomyces punctatus DAOM BR117]KND00491.1 hypothetical protein SPPG_04807 [Spizellomyces punctatus DAOM BR117]|eukprot:XP_016608530.1 hypothetical protein SPPG_04807 [Spizellomyces punctatus DAOM BR117]